MSTRPSILAEFLSRVSAIQVANGYATDAGLKIFFGATPELGPDDPAAALALLVRDDSTLGDLGNDELTTLPVDVVALVKASGDQPWAAVEEVVADIKRAIETADRDFSGLLSKLLARGRTKVLSRGAGSTTVGAGVTYTATYLDQWGS